MMNEITDFFTLYKKQLLNMVWAVVGCFGLGVVLVTIITIFADDMTGVPVGSFMLMFAGCGMIILYGAMLLQTKFDLYLSFGATRKKVIIQYAVFMLLSVVIFWLGGILCVKLEELYHLYILKLEPDGEKIYSVTQAIAIGMGRIYLVETGIAVLVAAASLRWGKVVWWVFYFVFLVACQIPNLINMKVEESSRDRLYLGFIDMLGGSDPVQWVMCAAIGLVLSTIACVILRKQRVTL